MNIIPFSKYQSDRVLFDKDANGREIAIYKYEKCVFTGVSMYYPNVLLKTGDDNTLILPIEERTMSLKSSTIYDSMNHTYDPIDANITQVYIDPVFFFIYNTDNYFHFLYDSLPYLITFLDIKKTTPQLKLLMNWPNEQKTDFYPFVLEMLEIVGITKSDICMVDPSTQYECVYISTSYTHGHDSNLPPRREIYGFYREMVSRVSALTNSHIQTPPKIYVSRRTWIHGDFTNIGTNYTTRRKLANENELVDQLVSESGYVEVFTEKLTTLEKILYFANATHVIGAIGGGIANVLFSKPDTKLVALVSPTFLEVNGRFRYSLDCVDVSYYTNTQHTEPGTLKKYMRVRTRDGSIVGEIESIDKNLVVVSYVEGGGNTGWNLQNTYKRIELDQCLVIPLDEGLNSEWETGLIGIIPARLQ